MFDKLKQNLSGKKTQQYSNQQYAPPPGAPPPSSPGSGSGYRSGGMGGAQYGPPSGPPPGQPVDQYGPPSMPPPAQSARSGGQENALAALKRYDTVFVVDDSESMEMFWDQTRDALIGVVEEAVKYDDDGIDVFFFNNTTVLQNVTSRQQVVQLFNRVEPRRSTPTATALNRVLGPYMNNLEASKANPNLPKPKPLNLICLTDGAPNRGEEPDQLIVSIAQRLDTGRYPLNQCGLQFIQIGDDGEAREALQNLDDNMKNAHGVRDMVDTVVFEKGTRLDSTYLVKCLLGALNRKIDAQD